VIAGGIGSATAVFAVVAAEPAGPVTYVLTGAVLLFLGTATTLAAVAHASYVNLSRC
jgi:hypothetical protein